MSCDRDQRTLNGKESEPLIVST